jgi:hypothetical protein
MQTAGCWIMLPPKSATLGKMISNVVFAEHIFLSLENLLRQIAFMSFCLSNTLFDHSTKKFSPCTVFLPKNSIMSNLVDMSIVKSKPNLCSGRSERKIGKSNIDLTPLQHPNQTVERRCSIADRHPSLNLKKISSATESDCEV